MVSALSLPVLICTDWGTSWNAIYWRVYDPTICQRLWVWKTLHCYLVILKLSGCLPTVCPVHIFRVLLCKMSGAYHVCDTVCEIHHELSFTVRLAYLLSGWSLAFSTLSTHKIDMFVHLFHSVGMLGLWHVHLLLNSLSCCSLLCH